MPPKKRKATAEVVKQPLHEGEHGCKRRPKNIGDRLPAADIFTPGSIEGIRKEGPPAQRYETYKVRWRGYGEKYDTWEPIEHLAGSDDLIGDYKEPGEGEDGAPRQSNDGSKKSTKETSIEAILGAAKNTLLPKI